MTKRELIELLERLPVPDDTLVITPVTVDDAGFDYVNTPTVVSAKLDVSKHYGGDHSVEGDSTWDEHPDVEPQTCIAISFYDPEFFKP